MDYLRYYLNLIVPISAIAGFTLGGQWVWLGFSTIVLVIVADLLSPQDYAPRNMNSPALADSVIWVQSAFVLIAYGVFLWRMHDGFAQSGGALALAWLGAGLSLLWVSLIPNVGSAHELMHRKGPLAKWSGRIMFAIAGAPNRDLSHVTSHHLYFDTDRDHDTGRRGETVYEFVPRCFWGNTVEEYQLEKARVEATGHSVWGWHSQIFWSLVMVAAIVGLCGIVGGPVAALISALVMVVARLLGEALNFLQHYGLVREPGTPIESRHTWNHLSAVTRIIGLEITNHVNHHQDPDVPFYRLQPHPEGPQMRNILLWGIAAFIPPLWTRLIQKKLKEWDENHATPRERALAAEANARANWPNWFSDMDVDHGAIAAHSAA